MTSSLLREKHLTFGSRKMTVGGAPGGPEQDPGAAPDLTRDLGPHPPTPRSEVETRAETGSAAGTVVGTEVGSGAGIRAETRA